MSDFRYIVGIDLGTSSCALSYVDRYAQDPEPQTLAITQWHSQGLVDSPTLPSFCYIAKNKEREQFQLPFASSAPSYIVGALAQDRMLTHTDLVVHSAKSWLCHGGVDREANILPWHSDTLVGEQRLSPVFVSSLYLQHLKDVWNHTIAAGREAFRLEKQKIIITVPASFDEIASHLTLQAAELAGLGDQVALCEEPQAAFYYCLEKEDLKLSQDQNVLVVDIGGGTSDFCLLRSSWNSNKQVVDIQRIAVSEHILLGGDNIDLALAVLAESKLVAQGLPKLSGQRWAQLVSSCRALKEQVLDTAENDPNREYYLSLQIGSGAKLLGQTQTIALSAAEILSTVLEGFFPFCDVNDRVQEPELGLKEWGLPYAKDSAVSKHLASFLQGRIVDSVLFTGGTLVPECLRRRLIQIIGRWQAKEPTVLHNDAFELAVSRGASVYGYRQVHQTESVHAGYPRSLYIKVEQGARKLGLCIIPKGFGGHDWLELKVPGLQALLGLSVRFELYSSLHRENDRLGDCVELAELKAVSVLHTRLGNAAQRKGHSVPIVLRMRLAPSGLLELYCVPSGTSDQSYRIHFSLQENIRADENHLTELAQSLIPKQLHSAQEYIERFFGKERLTLTQNPSTLIPELEKLFLHPRKEWDLSTLRSLWPFLHDGLTRRSRSEAHESTWLGLAGYVLRPGFGESGDPDRIRDVQGIFAQGPCFPANAKAKTQWWIFWRRIAGGLDRKTQDRIFAKVYPLVRRGESSPEMILLLGALERVDMQKKIALGQWLSSDVLNTSVYREPKIWTLTRIANRLPLYGGPECVIRPSFVIPWVEKLLAWDCKRADWGMLANFLSHACRRVDDRELDLPEAIRTKACEKLKQMQASASLIDRIENYSPQDSQTVSLLLGDALPNGLSLSF